MVSSREVGLNRGADAEPPSILLLAVTERDTVATEGQGSDDRRVAVGNSSVCVVL